MTRSDVQMLLGHKEWAAGRKTDPAYDMDDRRAQVLAVLDGTDQEDDMAKIDDISDAAADKLGDAIARSMHKQKAGRSDASLGTVLERAHSALGLAITYLEKKLGGAQ